MLLTRVNVDALAGQRGRWCVTIDGRDFIARPVSAEAVAHFQEAIAEARTPRARHRATVWLLRRAYPWRIRYWWLPSDDPVRRILALEPVVRQEVFAAFFAFLGGRAMRPVPPTPSTHASTPGRTSPTAPGAPQAA